MLSYLRSDLYRATRNKTLIVALAFFPALVLAICLFGISIEYGILGAVATSPVTVGYSILHMVSGVGFGMSLLQLLSTFVVVDLVVADYKNGALKSLLVVPHARRSYVASKIVLAFMLSVATVAALVLAFTVLPLIFGVPYEHGTNALDLMLWVGLSTVVCFGYAMVGLFLALLVRRETPTWVLVLLLVWGFVAMAVMGIAGMAAELVPALQPLVEVMPAGLLYPYAQALMDGEAISSLGTQMVALSVVVPLAWAAVSAVGGWLAFRRRTL